MKLEIISESEANAAALRILIPAIVGHPVEIMNTVKLRSGGWSGVLTIVPKAIASLYFRPDIDGLVIVVDSDDTPVHTAAHETAFDPKCRACDILQVRAESLAQFKPRPVGKPFIVAVGLAVLTIEGWLLCGKDVHATEAHFARQLVAKPKLRHLRPDLKRRAYGTDIPSREIEKAKAIEHATRLAGSLDQLRLHFPEGFGLLERTLAPLRQV